MDDAEIQALAKIIFDELCRQHQSAGHDTPYIYHAEDADAGDHYRHVGVDGHVNIEELARAVLQHLATKR